MASRRRSKSPVSKRSRPSKGRGRPRRPPSAFRPFLLVPPKLQHHLLETITTAAENGRSPEEVAQVCLEVLLELTEARAGAVYLEDEQTKEMRRLAIWGEVTDGSHPTWDRLVPQVVEQGCLVRHEDVLAFPLKRLRILEGVLIVEGLPRMRSPSGEVVELLDFVAARLAVGIDHSRLAEKYSEKIARIRQLEEISQVLNHASLDESEALEKAFRTAIELVGAEAGALLLFRGEREESVVDLAVGPQGEALRRLRIRRGPGLAGEAGLTGRPVLVNSPWQDSRLADEVDPVSGYAVRTLLAVPLRARNRTLGVLEAVNKRAGRIFTRWDVEEFSSVASQVAIVLDNAKLFHDYQGKILRLQKLEEISSLLNSTLDHHEIRERAIEAATVLMDAEAGSLLLLDEEAGELYFEVALGEKGEGVREIRLKLGQGIAGFVAQTGEPVIVNDVQGDPRFSKVADMKSGFTTRNMVCVPVRARDKLLGVLQVLNKRDGGPFRQADLQDFISLANQVGIAIENAHLYEEINRLFEGFISASVLAIESRDPSTSGHSGRVATLTCALAEIVDRLDHGPFAEVRFDRDQIKEIRYAALLHDFGKVGVREHILVKAQKLFPGDLALLKARFDFIKRTLEVQALRKKLDTLLSGDREATVRLLAEIDEDLARRIAETDEILEYLLACNRPTLCPARGFDGLQAVAAMTYEGLDGPRPYLTPEEVAALSIPQGSLTAEERREIQNHVTHTYRFLSTIPWTRKLRRIPMIAYGHHEKLDGSGYPRGLAGEAIPIQTRMMTISDIYDALTAADRPYKAAVTTAAALQILEDEVRQGKVDGALLRIFIEGKVYLRTSAAP